MFGCLWNAVLQHGAAHVPMPKVTFFFLSLDATRLGQWNRNLGDLPRSSVVFAFSWSTRRQARSGILYG